MDGGGLLTLHTAASAAEVQLLRDVLHREHYLGAERPVGNALLAFIQPESGTIVQIFERDSLSPATNLELLDSIIRNLLPATPMA